MLKAEEFKAHLTNDIIPFWNKLKDEDYGGFYGYVDGGGLSDKNAPKGVIVNSRILWFYSSAYMLLKDDALLDMAGQAYRFMLARCVDKQYGGVYWSVNYDGSVADSIKHSYNQAFAIYALSAYYEASYDKDALTLAYELYDILEEKCSDENGYLEAFYEDFTPAENDKLSENGVMADRTMNTLLHVMEAYSELYRIDGNPKVADSLKVILRRLKDCIYNADKKRFEVFFDTEYNSLIDLESYGHDIESSWLIERACDALGDAEYYNMMGVVIDSLAQGALERGVDIIDTDNKAFAAMNNECEKGRVDTKKVWWVQAESITGFYNIYQRNKDNKSYLQMAENIWNFVKRYVIDQNTGEWIENITDINNIDMSQALVHPWKGPYHNGRMCIEMIKRLGVE